MIIDNPHIYREIIEETKSYFTHKGVEGIVTRMKEELDAYAARFGVFADRVWREEYFKQPSVTTSCASSSIGVSMSMKSEFVNYLLTILICFLASAFLPAGRHIADVFLDKFLKWFN